VGGPNSDKGTDSVVLYVLMYFLDLSKVCTVVHRGGGGGWSRKQRRRHGCSFIFQSSIYVLRTVNTCSIAGPHPVFLTALAFCAAHLIPTVKCTKLICSYNDTTKNLVLSVQSSQLILFLQCIKRSSFFQYRYALSCSSCACTKLILFLQCIERSSVLQRSVQYRAHLVFTVRGAQSSSCSCSALNAAQSYIGVCSCIGRILFSQCGVYKAHLVLALQCSKLILTSCSALNAAHSCGGMHVYI
jgi:hypothetical protein